MANTVNWSSLLADAVNKPGIISQAYSAFHRYSVGNQMLAAGIAARWGCFSCCNQLDPATLIDSGYPPGRGQYSMQCAHCKTYTWFDLTQQSEPSHA